jgi:hypothetical protein
MEPQKQNDGLRISPVMNLWQAAKYMRMTPNELFALLKKNPEGLTYQVIDKLIIIHKETIDKWVQTPHLENTLGSESQYDDYYNPNLHIRILQETHGQ